MDASSPQTSEAGVLSAVEQEVVLVRQDCSQLPQSLASHQRRCHACIITQNIERNRIPRNRCECPHRWMLVRCRPCSKKTLGQSLSCIGPVPALQRFHADCMCPESLGYLAQLQQGKHQGRPGNSRRETELTWKNPCLFHTPPLKHNPCSWIDPLLWRTGLDIVHSYDP